MNALRALPSGLMSGLMSGMMSGLALCLLLAGGAQAAAPASSQSPSQAAAQAANPRLTPVVRVAQEAGPAVVSIVSARQVEQSPFAMGNPFQRFFDELNRRQGAQPRPRTAQSLGSGVIVDGARGLVLTNAHVIAGGAQITVRLRDGREFKASLMGADEDVDLAVLRLDVPKNGQPLPQARMGDSATLMPGEPVVAIGNPYGFSHTVTSGIVSAIERSISTDQASVTGLIQTDAAINPGNSGGPLLNILGQVIGINAAVHAQGEGIGFAIPINKARRVLEELIATGKVAHIWLGLLGENMDQAQAAYCGLDKPCGMIVTDVFPGTPAEAAGIKPGDALITLGGTEVRDKGHFLGLLLNYSKGDTLAIQLRRGRDPFTVQLKPQVLDRAAGLSLLSSRWGFLPGQEIAGGVQVSDLKANSPSTRLGLKPGDVILQIGNTRIKTADDLVTAFFRYQMHNALILSVMRGGQVYNVRMRV